MPQERGGNLRLPSAGSLQIFTVLKERCHQMAHGPVLKLSLQRDAAELKGNKCMYQKSSILICTIYSNIHIYKQCKLNITDTVYYRYLYSCYVYKDAVDCMHTYL